MCVGDRAHNLSNSCGEPLGYMLESTRMGSGRNVSAKPMRSPEGLINFRLTSPVVAV